MEKILKLLNKLKEKGLIKDYAIAGGIATIYYTEAYLTDDVDIFIELPPQLHASRIISLAPVYNYIKSEGYSWKKQYIVIDKQLLEFIPVGTEIQKDALINAKGITYQGIKTRILTSEYIIAIALKVARPQDFQKIQMLLRQDKVNKNTLDVILKKYGLIETFNATCDRLLIKCKRHLG